MGVWILGDIGLIAVAEQEVEAGLAALVIASVPLWVILLRVSMGKRPVRLELLAVVVGFAGLVVLLRPGSGTVAIGWMLLLVLAAVIEASGQFASQYTAQVPDPFGATAWQLVGAGVALLGAGAALGEFERLDPAEFTSGTLWVSSYAYVNPVVSVALGWALLDEHIDAIILIGAGLVLASVVAAVRTQLSHSTQGAPESQT